MNVTGLDISTHYRYVLRHKRTYWIERETWDDDLEMWVRLGRCSSYFWERDDARRWMIEKGAA